MKKVLVLWFSLISFGLSAQDSTSRIRAIGLDVFQTLPALVMGSIHIQRAVVIEPTVYIGTKNLRKNKFLAVGYANVKQNNRERLSQAVSGFYIKFGAVYKPSVFYWGYNAVLSYYTMNGTINIKGNYFSDFQRDIPSDSGFGIGVEFFEGLNLKLRKNLSLRFALRQGCHLTQVGEPASFYMAGAGFRSPIFPANVVITADPSIQLFYLINKQSNK